MQKSAKFILPLLLTAALLFGFTGCADKNETPTNPTTEAATAASTAAPTTPVTLQAPVMKTEDWDAYTPTKYQDKEHLSVTLNLTANLTAQDTILYQNGSKYAELVGVIVPAKNQTAFDNLELNKDYNGVEYQRKRHRHAAERHPLYLYYERPAHGDRQLVCLLLRPARRGQPVAADPV